MSKTSIITQPNMKEFIFQLMGELIDRLAEKVVEKLEQQNNIYKTIPIELKTIENDGFDNLLKIDEVCNLLNISRGTLDNWRKNKSLIPDTYVGVSPRYKQSSIDNYLNKIY